MNYFVSGFLLLFCVILIFLSNVKLARRNAADVRVVWYLFSLSGSLAFVLSFWAESSGVVDKQGEFHGTFGEVLSFLLHAVTDVNAGVLICVAISFLIMAPQIFCYVLSGLSGCASAPIFMSWTLSFLVWGSVKSLSFASGVILVVPTYAYFSDWSGVTGSSVHAMSFLSVMLMAIAFWVLVLYRGLFRFPDRARNLLPKTVQKIVFGTNDWLTRNT